MNSEILAKTYIFEIKIVSQPSAAKALEMKGGVNMKDSLAMLLKTNVEKMSDNQPLAMLMNQKELKSLSGDVHENKMSYQA